MRGRLLGGIAVLAGAVGIAVAISGRKQPPPAAKVRTLCVQPVSGGSAGMEAVLAAELRQYGLAAVASSGPDCAAKLATHLEITSTANGVTARTRYQVVLKDELEPRLSATAEAANAILDEAARLALGAQARQVAMAWQNGMSYRSVQD